MAESCVIIGLGQIGMGYDFDFTDESAIYTHARAIIVHPAFRLVGAADVSLAQRARFEQRYGEPAFDQIENALQALQPDVVVIATSSEVHGSILAKVLNTCHPKLVLCEKPLACELDEARDMVEMCENANIDLFVNYMRRADPGVIEIKRRIDNDEIVTPFKINAWYSKGIFNNGSHFLNLLEFWLGDVTGVTLINPGRLWDNDDPEPDFELRFELGTVVFRAAWEEAFSYYCIEFLCPSGRLRYDKGGEIIEWQSVRSDPNFEGYRILEEQREVIANGMGIYQWHVYDQICKHLTGEATTLCTGRQALKTLEAIDLIIRQR
jgi:predicted dehydrogenase